MIKKEEKTTAKTQDKSSETVKTPENTIVVKNNIIFQVEKNDKTYSFSIPYGTPLGVGLDACFQIANEIIAILQKAVKDSQEKMNSKKPGTVETGTDKSGKKESKNNTVATDKPDMPGN